MKLLFLIFIILLVVYLFLTLYYYFAQNKFIFFPTKTYIPPAEHLNIEEVFITTNDNEKLHGWFLANNSINSEQNKTVLYFHGNSGNLTEGSLRLKIFNDLGLNALIIDYRGYGKSSGKIKLEKDLYNDGLAAWQFLINNKKITAQDIIIWGRSLGGAVACELAQNKNIAGVILEDAFFSLPEAAPKRFSFLPLKIILKFNFANGEKIKNISAPILIIHSQDDETIPFAQGEKLFKAATEPKQFLKLSGSHNTDIIESYETYIRGIKNFLQGI